MFLHNDRDDSPPSDHSKDDEPTPDAKPFDSPHRDDGDRYDDLQIMRLDDDGWGSAIH